MAYQMINGCQTWSSEESSSPLSFRQSHSSWASFWGAFDASCADAQQSYTCCVVSLLLTAWWRCGCIDSGPRSRARPGRSALDPPRRQLAASRHPQPPLSAVSGAGALACSSLWGYSFLSMKASLGQCYLFRLLSFHSAAFLAVLILYFVECYSTH